MLSAAAQPSSNQPTSSSRRGFWPRRSGASTQSVEAATNAPVNVPPKRLFAACLPLCLSAPHVQIRRRPQSTEPRDSICDCGPSAPEGWRQKCKQEFRFSHSFPRKVARSPQTDMTAKANPRTYADAADGQTVRKQQQHRYYRDRPQPNPSCDATITRRTYWV